jgi:diamine N-acetyltransferase
MNTPEISLREITRETLRDILRLKVAPEQEKFVASNAASLAEALFNPGTAWYRVIYADEAPAGFVMMEIKTSEQKYFLWRFMIDARFQKQGIGCRALELAMDHVKNLPGGTVLETSCVPGEGSPGPFYEKMGFFYTRVKEDGELVMRKNL